MTQEIEVLRRCVNMFDTAILKCKQEIAVLQGKLDALEICRAEFQQNLSDEEEFQITRRDMEDEEYYYKNGYEPMPSDNPEYIVASTSSRAEETYVFESDSNGDRISSSEYGGIALRYGHKDWMDRTLAVQTCFPHQHYKLVRGWDWMDDDYMGTTNLYKRLDIERIQH